MRNHTVRLKIARTLVAAAGTQAPASRLAPAVLTLLCAACIAGASAANGPDAIGLDWSPGTGESDCDGQVARMEARMHFGADEWGAGAGRVLASTMDAGRAPVADPDDGAADPPIGLAAGIAGGLGLMAAALLAWSAVRRARRPPSARSDLER